ncbi:hypothetical protein LTR17_004464 [Elasticomyces elasticus]|nr:hypothetical protein LTR17_004464 [Elasticomyces elasticus]
MANNNSPALGDLGRLSGEVRNLIYELVIPEAQTCAFPTTEHYLPASRPGLIFASRKFHTEMLKMYYWRTNWTMTIKNTLTTGHALVTTGNKAFKKSTSKKPVKRPAIRVEDERGYTIDPTHNVVPAESKMAMFGV